MQQPIIEEVSPRQVVENCRDLFPEFSIAENFLERASTYSMYCLQATVQGEIAGYKAGFARNDELFYSWYGGVAPAFRRLGVARALLVAQEQWARQQGFLQIEVKTRNRFRGMLFLLLHHDYHITDVTVMPDMLDNKIWLRKSL